MVHCSCVPNTDCTVAYQYGTQVNDIAGFLVFRFSEREGGFEVIKEPEKAPPWEVHVIRKKISYEVGWK